MQQGKNFELVGQQLPEFNSIQANSSSILSRCCALYVVRKPLGTDTKGAFRTPHLRPSMLSRILYLSVTQDGLQLQMKGSFNRHEGMLRNSSSVRIDVRKIEFNRIRPNSITWHLETRFERLRCVPLRRLFGLLSELHKLTELLLRKIWALVTFVEDM